MAKDPNEKPPEDLYSNPDQATGFSDDNDWVKYWDPEGNKYQTLNLKGLTGAQKRSVIGGLDLGNYQNDQGEMVYGARPEGGLALGPGGDIDSQYMMQGYTAPDPKWDTGGLSLGAPPGVDQSGGTGDPGSVVPTPIDPGTSVTPGGGGPPTPGGTPGGGGGGGGGAYNPTKYNWNDYQPGAPGMDGGGGYDPADYAFERYVPGQESPWGIPDVEGGNKDFYRNQFMNLLNQEQGFQGKQRDAAMRAEEAAANPLVGPENNWNWLEGGLPDVRVAEGSGEEAGWDRAYGDRGMSNREIVSQFGGQFNPAENQWFQEQSDQWNESPWLSTFDDPNAMMDKVRKNNPELSGTNMGHWQTLANLMFSKTGGSAGAGGTPAGYAYLPGVGPGA